MGSKLKLINANALLQELNKSEDVSMLAVENMPLHLKNTAKSITQACFSLMKNAIKEAPTIDWVRHEHWEYIGDGMYKCTNKDCGEEANRFQQKFWKYCPNCGARMDGDKDGKK